jgi:phenylacetate-CoA ligase
VSARALSLSVKLSIAARGTKHLYAELLHNERLPRDELDRLADARAIEMAAFAYDNSPFYRDLYGDAGLSRTDLRDPEAFSSLPVLDRTMVQENQALIRSSEGTEENMRACNTAGSTGQPLRTYVDKRVPLRALSWRMRRWWGIAPSDNVAHVGRWGMSKRSRLAWDLAHWPSKVALLDVEVLDDTAIDEFVALVNRLRPRMVEGYLNVLHDAAMRVERAGLRFHAPVAVGTTGSPLTAEMRQYVERTLGAPVHDQYRSSEIPWLAGECGERNGLHVFADMRRIEVVDNAKNGAVVAPGTTGELVVTDFSNRVFPLVRYWMGDRGSLRDEACPCGVTLPMMDPPDGRVMDTIRLPDGSMVAAGLLSMFREVPDAVRLFRVRQAADFSITLEVVEGSHPRAREQVADVAQGMRERFRNQISWQVEFVDSLPYTGGKVKFVTSDLETETDQSGSS